MHLANTIQQTLYKNTVKIPYSFRQHNVNSRSFSQCIKHKKNPGNYSRQEQDNSIKQNLGITDILQKPNGMVSSKA